MNKMKNILNIREYEKISEFNDPEHKIDKYFFDDLTELLEKYMFDKNNQDIFDCLTIRTIKKHGRTFMSKNYIGSISLKHGQIIQILPKIDFSYFNEKVDEIILTKKIILKMLNKIDSNFPKNFGTSNLSFDRLNIYEVLILIYCQKVKKIIDYGIKRNYINETKNIKTLKGKLNVSKNITINAYHKEKFYCTFNVFTSDILENRIIKSTLLFLYSISKSISNKNFIKKLLIYFDDVNSKVVLTDFDKLSFSKKEPNYLEIMNWSKMFLSKKSFNSFVGNQKTISLLFPMDKLFEKYIASCVKKHFSDKWVVKTQSQTRYLFTDVTNNTKREVFGIRPDIILVNKITGKIVVMDTKWKRLINNPHKNYGISSSDIYQMYAYANKYQNNIGPSEVYILYPLNQEFFEINKNISFSSKEFKKEIKINAFFMNLLDIEKSMFDLKNKIENSDIDNIKS